MKSKKIIGCSTGGSGCNSTGRMQSEKLDGNIIHRFRFETAEVFSLAKVLNLGANYLTSLDYDNAILQYIDIIQHDPTNKEAYAGLYAAYAAQGKADEANKVFEQAQEVYD